MVFSSLFQSHLVNFRHPPPPLIALLRSALDGGSHVKEGFCSRFWVCWPCLGQEPPTRSSGKQILQRVEVPNAGFNIALAFAKQGGEPLSFSGLPDPNIVYLADGQLVYAYTEGSQELMDISTLLAPACTFQGKHPVSTAVTPAAGVLLRAYATNA